MIKNTNNLFKTFLGLTLFFILGAKDFHHFPGRIDRDRPKRPYHEPPPAEDTRPGIAPQPAITPDENSSPELSPEVYPENKQPPVTLPDQGTVPKIHKPKPMELQDEGNFMSHPMPQRNPGPSAVFPMKPEQQPLQKKKDR